VEVYIRTGGQGLARSGNRLRSQARIEDVFMGPKNFEVYKDCAQANQQGITVGDHTNVILIWGAGSRSSGNSPPTPCC
jgi:hypothetical protein